MQQLSLQQHSAGNRHQMEKCGSHVVSGGSQQQPSHSLPPIKETDDDNSAAVEAVVPRPSGSSSASATTPATPAAATAPTPGSASAPTPGTRAAATAPTPGSASAPSQRAAPRQQIGNRPHDDRMREGLVEDPDSLRQEWCWMESGWWWTRGGPAHEWYPWYGNNPPWP